ncbi:MAG: Rossmann-like domain-containing protein [Promethearchaeota archaeon]
MSITKDFIEIIKQVSETINLPPIQEIFIPPDLNTKRDSKKSNFGAIRLEDGTIGIVFLNLTPEIRELASQLDVDQFIGVNPAELANEFGSSDNLKKMLGLGAINSISQHFFKRSEFPLNFTTDSLGLLNLKAQDHVGMVGFFPPLVKKIETIGIPLIVIEKKAHLIKKTEKWEVTLKPSRLRECNKVLCTSTAVLNDSIDEILRYCSKAEKISIIGPTAGFIPDPLFTRGVDIVGSTFINNTSLFMELIHQKKRWGTATRKYCIQKRNYPGIDLLLNQISRKE